MLVKIAACLAFLTLPNSSLVFSKGLQPPLKCPPASEVIFGPTGEVKIRLDNVFRPMTGTGRSNTSASSWLQAEFIGGGVITCTYRVRLSLVESEDVTLGLYGENMRAGNHIYLGGRQ